MDQTTHQSEKQPEDVRVNLQADSITWWQNEIMSWAEEKGWNQNLNERSFGDWCTLITSEISEAYEDYRDHRKLNEVYFEVNGVKVDDCVTAREAFEQGNAKPCGIPIEMADAVIRIMHLAAYSGYNLAEMIEMKMAYNRGRAHRHGGKKV